MLTKIGALKIAAKKTGVSFEEYQEKLAAGLKWCSKGRHFAPIKEFGLNKLKYDRHEPQCRSCSHVKVKVNTKGRLSTFKGHTHTIESRQKMSEAHLGERNHRWKDGSRKMKTTHEAMMARRITNHAIEAGRLPMPKTLICVNCGKLAREYHHHLGYAPEHQLDVVPVCSRCNKALS